MKGLFVDVYMLSVAEYFRRDLFRLALRFGDSVTIRQSMLHLAWRLQDITLIFNK